MRSGAPHRCGKPAATEDHVSTDPAVVAAREALKTVGVDPAADKVWMAAINNPKIAKDDRESLIEDLNEVGFKDPEKPTLADMPKIKARLALIDQLAPKAIDDTNRAAFAEARKDLVDMAGKAKP